MGMFRSSKVRLREACERWLGVQIFRSDFHGVSACADIVRSGVHVATLLDVGANVGGAALEFRRWFPQATVHCFEPIPSTLARLRENVGKDSLVRVHGMALGCSPGKLQMFVGANDLISSAVFRHEGAMPIEVEATTVDRFCADHDVGRIDLLKVDAEGFDLEVLKGATGMLTSGSVQFVLVETTLNRGVVKHVLLDDIRDFLLGMNFALFGVYDQSLAWDGRPMLQFANALFRWQGRRD